MTPEQFDNLPRGTILLYENRKVFIIFNYFNENSRYASWLFSHKEPRKFHARLCVDVDLAIIGHQTDKNISIYLDLFYEIKL
jgi:hypothetical protein